MSSELPEIRQAIITALEGFPSGLTPKVAANYEKAIYKMCCRIAETDEDIDDVYAQQAYEKVGELMLCECRDDREKVLADIKGDIVRFDSTSYSEIRNEAEIDARILTEGMKIKKGEIPCKNPKCKSTETYYYSLQTRSADEGSSIYLTCVKCGHKARIQ